MNEQILKLLDECRRLRKEMHEAPMAKVYKDHKDHRFIGVHTNAWSAKSREWSDAVSRLEEVIHPMGLKRSTEIPCQHIADYYQMRWDKHHCIGYNLLRHGYSQWAMGLTRQENNLYGP